MNDTQISLNYKTLSASTESPDLLGRDVVITICLNKQGISTFTRLDEWQEQDIPPTSKGMLLQHMAHVLQYLAEE